MKQYGEPQGSKRKTYNALLKEKIGELDKKNEECAKLCRDIAEYGEAAQSLENTVYDLQVANENYAARVVSLQEELQYGYTDDDTRMLSGILRKVKTQMAGLRQKNKEQEQMTEWLRAADTARLQQLVIEKLSSEIKHLQQKNTD